MEERLNFNYLLPYQVENTILGIKKAQPPGRHKAQGTSLIGADLPRTKC